MKLSLMDKTNAQQPHTLPAVVANPKGGIELMDLVIN